QITSNNSCSLQPRLLRSWKKQYDGKTYVLRPVEPDFMIRVHRISTAILLVLLGTFLLLALTFQLEAESSQFPPITSQNAAKVTRIAKFGIGAGISTQFASRWK